jgi:hypothetical protein
MFCLNFTTTALLQSQIILNKKTSEYYIELGNPDIFLKRTVNLYAAFLESLVPTD